MTVSELIEKLKEMPGDLPVFYINDRQPIQMVFSEDDSFAQKTGVYLYD